MWYTNCESQLVLRAFMRLAKNEFLATLLVRKFMSTQLQRALTWADTLDFPATPATLDMLFAGEIAGLCVPDFLSAEECARLRKNTAECHFQDYLNVSPRIEKFGITVFEYDKIGKKQYFDAVEPANRTVALLTNGICRPLQRVLDWFSALCPGRSVDVAYEPGFGPYFAGLFRRIEEGTLVHVDFAPVEQPGWAVAQVCNQLTFNIYLDTPKVDPGLVFIWQKQAQPEDQRFKIPDSYGYRRELVADVPYATITPQTGMFMVINTRNFHQVSPSSGSRLTFSASVGQRLDKNLVLWS